MRIYAECPCGNLFLDETHSSFDCICNYDGLLCGASKPINQEEFIVVNEKECEEHKINSNY